MRWRSDRIGFETREEGTDHVKIGIDDAPFYRGGNELLLACQSRYSQLPHDAPRLMLEGLRRTGRQWGRFDVRLSGSHPMLRLVGFLMNLRSRLTGVATGDQAMFMTRAAYRATDGFPAIALMEDIAMSTRLKGVGRPLCLAAPVITSSRRWESRGILRTILLMWRLRLSYFLGADPDRLARIYYRDA